MCEYGAAGHAPAVLITSPVYSSTRRRNASRRRRAAIPSVVFGQDEDTLTLKANKAISARSHHQSLALTTRCGSSEAFLLKLYTLRLPRFVYIFCSSCLSGSSYATYLFSLLGVVGDVCKFVVVNECSRGCDSSVCNILRLPRFNCMAPHPLTTIGIDVQFNSKCYVYFSL